MRWVNLAKAASKRVSNFEEVECVSSVQDIESVEALDVLGGIEGGRLGARVVIGPSLRASCPLSTYRDGAVPSDHETDLEKCIILGSNATPAEILLAQTPPGVL